MQCRRQQPSGDGLGCKKTRDLWGRDHDTTVQGSKGETERAWWRCADMQAESGGMGRLGGLWLSLGAGDRSTWEGTWRYL